MRFGAPVQLSGDTLVVGALESRPDPVVQFSRRDAYAAVIFKNQRERWVYEATITANDAEAITLEVAGFVSIDGDRIVLGSRHDAPTQSRSTGSVYVFDRDSGPWRFAAKLVPSDVDTGTVGLFGAAASISGDVVVVGAPATEDIGPFTGAAYLFRYNGRDWVEEAKIIPSNLDDYAFFGGSVAINGTRIAVSAEFDRTIADAEGSAGVVYVFRHDSRGWVEEARLTGPNPDAFDVFGRSIAMNGDRLVVGDPTGDSMATVHVFRRDNQAWTHEATLRPESGNSAGLFGSSVSVDGDRLAVGDTYGISFFPTGQGAIHVFRRTAGTWQHEATIPEPPSEPTLTRATFGEGVAIADGFVVGGSYVYDLERDHCDQTDADGSGSGPASTGSSQGMCGAGALAAVFALLCLRFAAVPLIKNRTTPGAWRSRWSQFDEHRSDSQVLWHPCSPRIQGALSKDSASRFLPGHELQGPASRRGHS